MKTVNRNWAEIKRAMALSLLTKKGWVWYSQHICNGLSNHVLTTSNNGQLIYFVEHLPYYAKIESDNYLRVSCGLADEQIEFIKANREFLKTIT